MGWFSNAALREAQLLKTLLKLASFSVDGSGNVTGFVDANGDPVYPIEKTFAQLQALTPGDIADGAVIAITDVHGTTNAGPSYVTWDAITVGWGQMSGPWSFATLDLAPDPSEWPGLLIYSQELKAVLVSNGVSYRFLDRYPKCMGHAVNVTKAATKTDEEVILVFEIPIDANGKSLLQSGDQIIVDYGIGKSGTGQTFTTVIRLGTNSSPLSNTIINTYTTGSTASIGLDDVMRFTVLGDTSIRRLGPIGSQSKPGVNSTTRNTTVGITSLNSAVQYFSMSFMLVAGTSDTLTAEGVTVSILHSGA